MQAIKHLYLKIYFIAMALYVFFNKGIAYSFMAEILWAMGLFIILLNRKKYEFVWTRQVKILFFFLLLGLVYIPIGMRNNPVMDVIRDSFIFQYGWFVFIIFMYQDDQETIWKYLINIYTWFPVFGILNFIALNFIYKADQFILFGDVPLVLYKYGDLGVHLLISSLVLLNFQQNRSIRFQITIGLLIVFNLLILTAYSRSGMLSYLMGVGLFVYYSKDQAIKDNLKKAFKFLPVILIIVVPIYASIKVQENFQGRTVGIEQLKENAGSFVGISKDANLDNNKIWRLVWWGKILDYSFSPQYFLQGKGLGMSLAAEDEIMSDVEELRSPHNFHLNIMARFGVPVFCLWLYWLFLLFKPLFKKQLGQTAVLISVILIAFIINSSFDVFLEGPMGAFPFWTFVGLLFITKTNAELVDGAIR